MITLRDGMDGTWTTHKDMCNARKTIGTKHPGESNNRGIDIIKMYNTKTECLGMEWISMAFHEDQWRKLVKTVMNLYDPIKMETGLTSCDTISLSKGTLSHLDNYY
jgi:hypothetical protein